MLKTIDVLIGLSVVMLLMSMIVTVMTQFVTSLLNSRGKHLWQGLADLLQQISPEMKRQIAEEIAGAVLSHPLIRDVKGRFGTVIHREELTKLLLGLASNEEPQAVSAAAMTALQNTLVSTGVCSPGSPAEIEQQIKAKIKNIAGSALQLELEHPELSNADRARIAILQQANSEFVAKIHLWFDQTIDRISGRFTYHTRYITFAASLLLALAVQLDTAALVSRLASDDALRNSLVAEAQNPPQNPELNLSQTELQNIRDLMTNNVVGIPLSASDWAHRWSKDTAPMKIVGILLSSILLSLGAPFWYNALQNLLRMRSLVAAKDDVQRQERQLTNAPALPVASKSQTPVERVAIGEEHGELAVSSDGAHTQPVGT